MCLRAVPNFRNIIQMREYNLWLFNTIKTLNPQKLKVFSRPVLEEGLIKKKISFTLFICKHGEVFVFLASIFWYNSRLLLLALLMENRIIKYQTTYNKHILKCCPILSSNNVICLFLQLLHCIKWFGLVHHRQKRCIRSTENTELIMEQKKTNIPKTFKQDHTGYKHVEKNHSCADKCWSIILSLQ